jgi:hypothetical protein
MVAQMHGIPRSYVEVLVGTERKHVLSLPLKGELARYRSYRLAELQLLHTSLR